MPLEDWLLIMNLLNSNGAILNSLSPTFQSLSSLTAEESLILSNNSNTLTVLKETTGDLLESEKSETDILNDSSQKLKDLETINDSLLESLRRSTRQAVLISAGLFFIGVATGIIVDHYVF